MVDIKFPIIISGDFNLVRFQKDKCNGAMDLKWCDKFNEWIDRYSLLEIELSSRSFTWSNNQANAVMSHIDIFFCCIEFDAHFPLSLARSLPRNPSDYVPLLWGG
jgi:hypothetical protein